MIRLTTPHQGVFSTNRAGPSRESPPGFRIAPPLHNKKETPGEAPGVESAPPSPQRRRRDMS